MKMKTLTPLALLVAAVAVNAAEGDPQAGKEKSATCTACHGTDGNSTDPQYPKIAGQHASYIFKQLEDYKSGERSNPIMAGMVGPLEEQDMRDLAAYYASQSRTGGFAAEELVERGKRLYRGGNAETGVPACIGCHGATGDGDPLAPFPSLHGQHSEYSVAQLRAFRDDERTNDYNAMMRDAVQWLTDEEIEAVSSYLAGLH